MSASPNLPLNPSVTVESLVANFDVSGVATTGRVSRTLLASALVADGLNTTANLKDAVRCAVVTTNIDISTGLVVGASVGGVTLVLNDRVLLGGQTNKAQNGIYAAVASGAASRTTDLNDATEFPGATVYVREGTNIGKRYAIVPASNPPTVGTTAINVVQVGQDPISGLTTQTVGSATTPVTGVAASDNNTWVLASPIAYDGFISRLRVFSLAASEIRLRKFTKSGNNFTAFGGDISIPVAVGLNTFTRSAGSLPLVEVLSGQYIGVYARKGSSIANVTQTSAGYYNASGDLSAFTDATVTTTEELQIDFLVEQTAENIQSEKLVNLSKTIFTGQQTIGVGAGLALDVTGAVAAQTTFVFKNPVISDGFVSKIEVSSKASGRFYFKRFTKSGNNFTQVGSDITVNLSGAGTLTLTTNSLPYLGVYKDEYIGIYIDTALITTLDGTVVSDSYGDPYYSPAANANSSSFGDSTTTQTSIQIRFTVDLGNVDQVGRRVEALESKLVNPVTQTIGSDTTPATGAVVADNNTWVLAEPVYFSGFVSQFRIFSTASGDVRIRKFSRTGNDFTAIGGDVSLSVAAGLNTFTRASGALPLIEVNASEYLGLYARSGALLTNLTLTNIGYYNATGDVYTFTDSTATTSQALQLDFLVEQTTETIQAEKLTSLSSVLNTGQQFVGVGNGLTFDTSGSAVAANTFVFRNPVLTSGCITKIEVGSKGDGYFYFKRFTKSGDNFTQVGSDIPITVTGTGTITINQASLPYLEVAKDEYIGIYPITAKIASLTGVNSYADPYYSPSVAANSSGFTDTAVTQTSIQIRFTVQLGEVDRVDRRVDALTTLFSSPVQQTIGANATPVTGSALGDDQTRILAVPVAADGFISRVRIFSTIDGDVRIRRFTKSGDDFTAAGGDISVGVVAGLNTFLKSNGTLPLIDVKAGQYLGFYSRKGGCVCFLTETGSGFWNSGGNVDFFTDSSTVTTQTPQIDFLLEQTTQAVQAEKFNNVASLIDFGPQIIGVGKGLPIVSTGSFLGSNTFVFRNQIVAAGYVSKIEIGAQNSGRIYVRRFTKTGDTFNQIGSDVAVDISGAGLITLEGGQLPLIEVHAGEYIGFFRGTGIITFLVASTNPESYADPFYSPAAGGNVSTFTDTATTANSIQVRFTISFGDTPRLDRRISDIESRITSSVPEIDFYADTIASATMTPSGFSSSVSVTLNREGVEQTLTDLRTFTGTASGSARYDVLYLNGKDLTFGVAAGTQRTTDYIEFAPTLTDSGYIPLFAVRVSSFDIKPIPVWRLNSDGDDRAIADQLDLDRQYSKRCLPKFLGKVSKGSNIRILGFGDSITSIRSATESLTTPNGAERDRATAIGTQIEYLYPRYQTDLLNTYPLFTAVQLGRADDSAGQVHTKIGWNWELVAALQARGYVLGTSLFYDNFGVAGYNSADAVNNTTLAPSAWFTAAMALNADLAVIGLGMNERGNVDSERRFVSIAEQFKAAGTDVIFMGVPASQSSTVENWQFTNRALRRAALKTNSAYVPTNVISDNRFIHSMGISTQDTAAADAVTHPGTRELKAYGKQLVRHVLG